MAESNHEGGESPYVGRDWKLDGSAEEVEKFSKEVETRDEVLAKGKWEFDEEVTKSFDDMLKRSIPQHDEMRRACFEVGSAFVLPSTQIVDLGCSRGEALAQFVEKFGAYNRYTGVEVSAPMLDASRARFKGWIDSGIVDIRGMDLRKDYPPVDASLTLCVLTMQFIPIEHRQKLLGKIFEHTRHNGAVILVEKVLGSTCRIDEALTKEYLNMKRRNGYTDEQIERKKLSLEGVLVPVTARWNEELLLSAGFKEVDSFWRYMNFCGWIGIKR